MKRPELSLGGISSQNTPSVRGTRGCAAQWLERQNLEAPKVTLRSRPEHGGDLFVDGLLTRATVLFTYTQCDSMRKESE